VEGLVQFLPLILLVVIFYFFVIRRAQNQQRETRSIQSSLAPGQEVVTTAGLFARVVGVEDDAVLLEVAPGVTSRYARQAVARILSRPQYESDAEPDQNRPGPDTDEGPGPGAGSGPIPGQPHS
jgi:preprotein translocase subunit YajC